jgi:START domain.
LEQEDVLWFYIIVPKCSGLGVRFLGTLAFSIGDMGRIKVLKTICSIIIYLFCSTYIHAQDKWVLSKNTDGIRVYSLSCSKSHIKKLKADFTVKSTTAKLAATLLDLPGYAEWVYSTKTTTLVKQLNPREVLYYTEKHMPWPMSNRDAVIQLKVEQPDSTGVLIARLTSMPGIVPVKKDVVRIPHLKTYWRAIPQPNNTLLITYEAEIDPGGSIPNWILNMFSTKGPLETFKKMRVVLERT